MPEYELLLSFREEEQADKALLVLGKAADVIGQIEPSYRKTTIKAVTIESATLDTIRGLRVGLKVADVLLSFGVMNDGQFINFPDE